MNTISMEAREPIKSTLYVIQSAYICIFMYISHNLKLWNELIWDIPLECIISSTHDNINNNLSWNLKMYSYSR